MARQLQQVWRREWTPNNKTSTETAPLFSIPAGFRVLGAYVRILTGNTTGTQTIELGDDGDTDRFIKTTDVTIDTPAVYPNVQTGAGLLATGGYLYTTANTIDVVYTADGTSTVAVVARFTVVVENVAP